MITADSVAQPYLHVQSTILLINVTIPPASPLLNNSLLLPSKNSAPEKHPSSFIADKIHSTTEMIYSLFHHKKNSPDTKHSTDNGAPRFQENDLSYSNAENASELVLLYEVFLTYMYEGDMNEEQYWEVLIATSSPEGVRQYATKIGEFTSKKTSIEWPPPFLFVSYSGVGTVISVVVTNVNVSSTNGVYIPGTSPLLSNGTLYSSSVSYGCNFIPGEEYRCSKLINPLTEVFCASLFFIGLVLALFGHRWLNFTFFTAGFFAAWLFLFLIFIQIPDANIHGKISFS